LGLKGYVVVVVVVVFTLQPAALQIICRHCIEGGSAGPGREIFRDTVAAKPFELLCRLMCFPPCFGTRVYYQLAAKCHELIMYN